MWDLGEVGRTGIRRIRGLSKGSALALGLIGGLVSPALAQDTLDDPPGGMTTRAERPPRLGLPVDCRINTDCWVTSYVDVDPGPGVKDFMCGPLSKRDYTPNADPDAVNIGHKGVDIGIGHITPGRSVAVLAAAAGTVVGVRDGMADVSTRADSPPDIKGKECGNGVRIDHGNGWATQYCHLAKGSLAVGQGQTVQQGQTLGMIGLSGMTEHPHVHVQVSRDGVIYDPFKGRPAEEGCEGTGIPLWTPEVFAKLRYSPLVINNVGFAAEVPNRVGARAGIYPTETFPATAEVLLIYVDVFAPQKGDHLRLEIIGPDGAPFHVTEHDFDKKSYAQWFSYAGKKLAKRPAWDPGVYTAVVTVERPGKGVVGWREARITVE